MLDPLASSGKDDSRVETLHTGYRATWRVGWTGAVTLNSRSVLSLADEFLAAALGSSPWEAAMDAAAAATGSVGSVLLQAKTAPIGVPASQSIGTAAEAYFGDGWATRDERTRAAPVMLIRGVTTDLDIMSPDEMARHPYYQEFLAPHGLKWFAGVKVSEAPDWRCLSIQRSVKQEPFSDRDLEQLALLSPHLSTAAAIARALGFARMDAAVAAFEASGTPVVMLDGLGQVRATNQAADRLFGPHLTVASGRLRSWSREATANLDRALHRLYWAADGLPTAEPVLLPRLGGRPIVAYASRLPEVTDSAFAPARAVVVLNDLEGGPLPPDRHLAAIFGLTPSEARLAVRVGAGESIETAAEWLGITNQTARTVLKAVMQKTDTHRQAELVALIGRITSVAEPAGPGR